MKKILLLAALVSFTSCKDLDGTFKVKKDLVFKTKKRPFSSKYVKVKVPANEYSATFKFTSSSKMKIIIAGIDKKIKIKFPKELDVNPRNDNFYINGSDIKQNYDFDGRIKTDVTRTDDRHGSETCSYTTYETVCHRECHTGDNGRVRCHSVCNQMPRTHYGRRNVEYYYETSDTVMKLKVLEPSTSEVLGLFKGKDHKTRKVITYSSMCR
ncbi:hypothetical protein A9Q84_15645 [Halobacteriovorax marinus]|uniref:Lipoprotein n=1 Tax=Halobacteriovorax marinus TaxID=97084 RepID=A0A1Y5F475_9BACT|nr:hypothetical protein A9Q84_15645 [Halobacteriovorax marinus]